MFRYYNNSKYDSNNFFVALAGEQSSESLANRTQGVESYLYPICSNSSISNCL